MEEAQLHLFSVSELPELNSQFHISIAPCHYGSATASYHSRW
jgi:hypothetical protein